MNLYIETENGVTKNHPAYESNLIEAFGQVPEHWEPFERVVRPNPGDYEVVVHPPEYQKINGVWKDVWTVRQMTEEEKAIKNEALKVAKRNDAIYAWGVMPNADNFISWVFNEETLKYEPPIPRPLDGKKYYWKGSKNAWLERPEKPNDGKDYFFDHSADGWIEITSSTQE